MSYAISDLKDRITGASHGTAISDIQNLYPLVNDAARQFLLDIDPQETKRVTQTPVIYDRVFDYTAPTDLKGQRVIDIRPQVTRTLRDRYNHNYEQEFDIFKDYTIQPSFTVDFNTGVKSIRINSPFLNTGLTINNADALATNGTWTASAGAGNLTQDTVNYVSSVAGALQFDITGTSGTLTNSTMTQVDLTAHLNKSKLFLYTYLPTGSSTTQVQLRWGSSASAYWQQTQTLNQDGVAFVNGWNLLTFDWATATQVGTPDVTKVNYLQIVWTTTGNQTGVHLEQVVSRLGVIMEIVYYSKYLFADGTTGTWKEKISQDSDTINLDTETYELFFYLVQHFITQQQQGLDALFFDNSFWGQKYIDGTNRYKAIYKSEVSLPRSTYYRQPVASYRNWFGRRFLR